VTYKERKEAQKCFFKSEFDFGDTDEKRGRPGKDEGEYSLMSGSEFSMM